MSRIPRAVDPEGTYHVICRGNNKSQIFHCAEDYEKYLSVLEKMKRRYRFLLYHYALMPNHVHILLNPSGAKLSAIMHTLQMTYAQSYCEKYSIVGHVWQGRFKSFSIESDAYLLACGNYIEMNPVRAGLVNLPELWQWSSYRYHAFDEPNPLVDRDPLFETLGNDEEGRRRIYRHLLQRTRAF